MKRPDRFPRLRKSRVVQVRFVYPGACWVVLEVTLARGAALARLDPERRGSG